VLDGRFDDFFGRFLLANITIDERQAGCSSQGLRYSKRRRHNVVTGFEEGLHQTGANTARRARNDCCFLV